MAAEKNSFVLYADLIHTISHLPDNLAGKLFKHILKYVNDENPADLTDVKLKIAWEPIKRQLKRDLEKWENGKRKRSAAGKSGAIKRWHPEESDSNAINAMAKHSNAINDMAKIAVTATATVNVTATAINRDKVIELLQAAAPTTITHQQLEQQAELLMKQYQGQKIGNLRALCNRWMNNYQEQQTMPSVELTYWDKMRAAL